MHRENYGGQPANFGTPKGAEELNTWETLYLSKEILVVDLQIQHGVVLSHQRSQERCESAFGGVSSLASLVSAEISKDAHEKAIHLSKEIV